MMQLLVEKLRTIELPSFDFWCGQVNNLEKSEVMFCQLQQKEKIFTDRLNMEMQGQLRRLAGCCRLQLAFGADSTFLMPLTHTGHIL